MFDKLKDLKKLKDLESALGKETLEKEKDGIRVVVNGRAEIVSIFLNNELDKEKQEQVLKECINDVSREAKMLMARKAAEITGFGF
ncbi:MAG: YbaB/EbfC family nucleoid-associated protein [Candidatus Paceibacterota bacterium]|jgi:DNA-binding protein YbaB